MPPNENQVDGEDAPPSTGVELEISICQRSPRNHWCIEASRKKKKERGNSLADIHDTRIKILNVAHRDQPFSSPDIVFGAGQ